MVNDSSTLTISDQFGRLPISKNAKHSRVRFTAYFTPVIDGRDEPDEHYRYPLYRRPPEWPAQGTFLTRQQIDGEGRLKNRNLEIAWTKNLFDNYMMQIQGSGYIRLSEDETQFLGFGGKNGHPYVNIAKWLLRGGLLTRRNTSLQGLRHWLENNPERLEETLFHCPSYVFFTEEEHGPLGASGVEIVAGYSVAVDSSVIPLGSPLLVHVPVLNEVHHLARREWRVVFAHDRGARIKGSKRLDLYMGIGDEAEKAAAGMHHTGQAWLLDIN